MRDEQLSNLYKTINQKQESYKNHKTEIWDYVKFIGFLVIMFTIIPIIPAILETNFGMDFSHSFVGGLIIGSILMIGSGYLGNPQPPSLSIIDIELLNVLESLKYIELHQGQVDDYWRFDAAKKLKKVEKRLKFPSSDNFLWTAIIQEYIDDVEIFKINFKERLIPNLIDGDDDDLVHSIIEEFARYLSSPAISKLKDLNDDLSKLKKVDPKDSQLKAILKHHYMNYFYFLIVFSGAGYFVFRLGLRVGVPIGDAYITGVGFFGTLIALYLHFVIKKMNN